MDDRYGNSLMKKPRRFRLVFCVIVTAVSCLVAYLLMVPLSESLLAKLFSAPQTSDFQMSDLFAQLADSRPVRQFEDSIVIVDIGLSGRAEIADGLEIISASEPKTVGLDVNFLEPKGEIDKHLIEALESQKNIVLPLGMKKIDETFEVEDFPFFYDSLKSAGIHYASVNLPTRSEGGSIREFEMSFPLNGDTAILSYPVELAHIGNPTKFRELMGRGSVREIIDYPSREFRIIPLESLIERMDELKDKYVLVGSLVDASDLHATPMNSRIPGLMIHANALATLLDGAYYRQIPPMLDYIAGVLLCFLLVYSSESLPGRGKEVFLRILRFIFLVLVVWLGYKLFVNARTILNFSFTFFVVGIGLIVLDIGNMMVNGWTWTMMKSHARKIAKHYNKLVKK